MIHGVFIVGGMSTVLDPLSMYGSCARTGAGMVVQRHQALWSLSLEQVRTHVDWVLSRDSHILIRKRNTLYSPAKLDLPEPTRLTINHQMK